MSKTPYIFMGANEESDDNMLKIFCRVKPLQVSGRPCFTLVGQRSLTTHPPPNAATNKPTHFTFRHVFGPSSHQKEIFDTVALPLIKEVLAGNNALLFTYGNTGSGKTYTMKGTLEDGGLMPRCLDVIFNSVTERLAPKNVFKPDKFNGFEILSEKEAQAASSKTLLKQIGISKGARSKFNGRKANSNDDLAGRMIDPTQILLVRVMSKFAIFVSFVEIYNNNAYDLLEDYTEEHLHPKAPQVKNIREDFKKNMFVFGVTEVEVASTEEAYEIYYKGLKKRKVAQTLLNTQSSRSHSIFTIRVVQADITGRGEGTRVGRQVKHSAKDITIGQLSLVDLAGSERTNRTQNTGKNLQEAGNINNSLMTLRQCFDALKENQKGANKLIPYRDSKLTTLFKNFFEGEGRISMIVCINPTVDDFDETIQVLRFAESTLEIELGPSLRKQMEEDKAKTQRMMNELLEKEHKKLDKFIAEMKREEMLILSQIPTYTGIENSDSLYCKRKFMASLPDDLRGCPSSDNFEMILSQMMESVVRDNVELEVLQSTSAELDLDRTLLKRKLDEALTENKRLKRELFEKDQAIMRCRNDKDKEKEKFQIKKHVYKEKFNSELDKRLKRQRTELEMEIQSKEERLARVQRVLSDEIISTSSTPSVASCRAKFENILSTPQTMPATPRIPRTDLRPTIRKPTSVAVSNRRHRRSRSAGDVWVEHKPAMAVPLNTVLQPSLPKRRSITKLVDAKQVTQGASKYCLMTQTQDQDGDMETRIYKGDVIPTSGGGAQVLFNDVEVLKQMSPDSSPVHSTPKEDRVDPQPACSYAYEGHRLRSHRV